MGLTRARLFNQSLANPIGIEVLFNPSEYTVDRGVSYAELQVPGLPNPIFQFVRGEAETLSLELFLDRTLEDGVSVEENLEQLRKFVRIDGELHAPPVCLFQWGATQFQGVVTSLKEKLQLFNEAGQVMRARVNLTLKSYRSIDTQLREQKLASPDRTRVRVVREGETLAQLAQEAYGNPRLWRVIAEANDIDRPRLLVPGTELRIPAL